MRGYNDATHGRECSTDDSALYYEGFAQGMRDYDSVNGTNPISDTLDY